MNLEKMHFFNRSEKIAILKLIIKIANADNSFSKQERETVQEFLTLNQLKISEEFIVKVNNEKYDEIISVFVSKSNMRKAYATVEEYANQHGIHPEFEAKALDEIKNEMELKKKSLKFSFAEFVKTLLYEFSFLWGKEDINSNIKSILAIVFTLLACVFGSIWTTGGYSSGIIDRLFLGNLASLLDGLGSKTGFVSPLGTSVISGFIIFGVLSFRNYLPRPTNFRNILFCIVNLYLLSIIAMHIVGRSGAEKGIIFFIFFGLILLLWLGMKEILGFVFIGFFVLLIWKLLAIDKHMDWRAFPFLSCAFMGISFQANNFFDDFSKISSSFFKKPEIEKGLVKESLQLAGARVGKVAKSTVSIGATAAGLPPGVA